MRFQTSYAVVVWNEDIQAGPKSSQAVLTSPDTEACQLNFLTVTMPLRCILTRVHEDRPVALGMVLVIFYA